MSSQRRPRATLLIAAALLFVALAGCIPPPPEAVLEGTWRLTDNVLNVPVSDFLVTFDRDGHISQITYVYEGFTITIDADSFTQSSSNVDGRDVSIGASWGSDSMFLFDGTLNAAETQIVGTTRYRLVMGPLIIVEIPAGPGVLTRQ